MKQFLVTIIFTATLTGCNGILETKGPLQTAEGITNDVPSQDVVVDDIALDQTQSPTLIRPKMRRHSIDEKSETQVASTEIQKPEKAKSSGHIGSTIASLGNPGEPGLWLKTPLVSKEQAGSLKYNGKIVDVTLIPIDGPKTAGSRMSLQTFQALGASLTDLVELDVSA